MPKQPRSRSTAPTAFTGGAAQREPRRRADAERSIASIVAAGIDCFRHDPGVSMTAVAKAAGVSRVTLYAHFPSREALLEAVLAHSLDQADGALRAQNLEEGPADEALSRLVRSGWRILDRHAFLLTASEGVLTAARRREHHAKVLDHVEALVQRGQEDGVFRTDLPLAWLVTVFYSLLHAAASDVEAGRLRVADAAPALDGTLSAAFGR